MKSMLSPVRDEHCLRCKGAGWLLGESPCSACNRSGRVSRRTRVYVAGPLGKPDVIGLDGVAANVRRAAEAAIKLVAAGFAPMVPHHNADWPGAWDYPHNVWMEIDLSWVSMADILVRLPGHSPGADMEVAHAKMCGIPVYELATWETLVGVEKTLV